MSMYHCGFLGDSALFSRLRHRLRQFFFLEHLRGTRRYITSRVRGSSGARRASYRRIKARKLALFSGVTFPEKLE